MKRQLIYHSHVTPNSSSKITVNVNTQDTQTNCHLTRVSRDGMTLSCKASTLQALMPNKASVSAREPISMSTCFKLGQHQIEAVCRVVFARRLSKNEYVMELKFVDISEQHMQMLSDYIRSALGSCKQEIITTNATLLPKTAPSLETTSHSKANTLLKVA